MIQKKTWLIISDNTNVLWLQIFHLYKGFFRSFSYSGLILKGSVRKIKPPRIEYRGFRIKLNKKGDICQTFLIRTKLFIRDQKKFTLKTNFNTGILLKKKKLLKSKYLFGPCFSTSTPKRISTLFKFIW